MAGTHHRADAHLHTPRAAKMRSGLSAKPKMWKSRSTGAVKGTWRLIGGTRMLVLTDICELATGADRVLARCSTPLIHLVSPRLHTHRAGEAHEEL